MYMFESNRKWLVHSYNVIKTNSTNYDKQEGTREKGKGRNWDTERVLHSIAKGCA